MRRIITALAVVWLESLGIVMAATEMSRHAASAAAVSTLKVILP